VLRKIATVLFSVAHTQHGPRRNRGFCSAQSLLL